MANPNLRFPVVRRCEQWLSNGYMIWKCDGPLFNTEWHRHRGKGVKIETPETWQTKRD